MKAVAGLAFLLLAILAGIVLKTGYRGQPTQEKVVALTFDDGPNPPYTEELLSILQREQVKATFFLIGQHVERFPQVVSLLIDKGHEVANHSYSHPKFRWLGFAKVREEILATDGLLAGFGVQDPLFRAPYGDWAVPLSLWLFFHGRKNILFTATPVPPDYTRPNPDLIVDSLLSSLRPGAIFALHDGEGVTVEVLLAVEKLIPELRQRGYSFVTVSQLMGREAPKAGPISDEPPEVSHLSSLPKHYK